MAVDLTALYSNEVSDSVREDLSDIITNIDPTETPIQANIGQVDVDNPSFYEWTLDGLNTPTDGGVEDGFDFSDLTDAVTTRSRLKAVCQIQARAFKISGRVEKANKAGVDSEIAHQLALRSDDLKRDCEKAITSFRSPVDADSGTAPLTAGIPTWIRTNRDNETGGSPNSGADPTLSNGEPVVGTDDSSTDPMDESRFLALLADCYDAGGNPDMVSVVPDQKQQMSLFFFSSNARIATQYQDHKSNPSSGLQVAGAVDYYVSDFGVLAIVPNRFQRSTDVLILDTSLWEIGTFRGYEVQHMGKDGDHERYALIHDFCLISRDESGSANLADRDATGTMTT